MKKIYLILAAAVGMTITSCTSNEYVGEMESTAQTVNDGSIQFGLAAKGMTRADFVGATAAEMLGGMFVVEGTKGTEATDAPSSDVVFDNYLVGYTANTAGTTESDTHNWEYVGKQTGITGRLSGDTWTALHGSGTDVAKTQSIKYWDYSTSQYDFIAWSTGTCEAVSDAAADGKVKVTRINTGTTLATNGFTLTAANVTDLKQCYFTDINTVLKANYGEPVTLTFKSMATKVRVALYETVPGYSVKDVYFYTSDANPTAPTDLGAATSSNAKAATLFTMGGDQLPKSGSILVTYPHIGTDNNALKDYNKAKVSVTAGSTEETTQTFGNLSKFVDKDHYEAAGSIYLGRNITEATFAGESKDNYYTAVFPTSAGKALTLRVDYTLVSTDGSGEEIHVYGAKAVVPATYTVWQPNYAYTYIFKISDNTNGWTSTVTTDPAGLFPITFDAVVAEATDATAEQKTITTVATPSITTYQQNHDITKDEYSIATGKDIYVQVMNNSTTLPTLYTDLNTNTTDASPTAKSRLFSVTTTGADISEATVMDALQSRKDASLSTDHVKGRNGITLTKDDNIDNTVTTIVNGVDNQPINVTAGEASKLAISSLPSGTYAYVYDYSDAAKTTVTEYQPITVTNGSAIGTTGVKYASIAIASLGNTETAANEDVDNAYIYFSKTTNGTGTTTYSYVSVTGKTKLPAGLIKVAKETLTNDVDGSTNAVADTFYFDIYTTNSGKYAVKVIKIVA